ncbi:MAG: hypothetical protein ACOYL5_04740 [Phototrophicaceae bacterium]|jgi:hypothetical protein
MTDHTPSDYIGHVLRASTNGFDFGTRGNEINVQHSFGSFVLAQVAGDDPSTCYAVGLIYAIRIADDPFVRELVMATEVSASTLMDQRKNRLVPIETLVLNVGYVYEDGTIVQSMPPRPPLSLTEVHLMPPDWVMAFVRKQDFFRLVLNAGEVPSDDLVAAAVRYAAQFFTDEAERRAFLVSCGRQVARLLTGDLRRLGHVVELIRP